MKNKSVWILCVAAVVAFAAAGTAWYHADASLRDLRASELKPIAALLKENQDLLGALQTDAGSDSGILAAYLAKIRADGVAKHAEMKRRLDRLAENNSAVVALIGVYSAHAKTAAFNAEAEKFRRHAIAWRDRWNSVMELFMAGGNYAASAIPFPVGFLAAVDVLDRTRTPSVSASVERMSGRGAKCVRHYGGQCRHQVDERVRAGAEASIKCWEVQTDRDVSEGNDEGEWAVSGQDYSG